MTRVVLLMMFVGCSSDVTIERNSRGMPVAYCAIDDDGRLCIRSPGIIGVCIVAGVCAARCESIDDCVAPECHVSQCIDGACWYPMSEDGSSCGNGACVSGVCE